VTNPLRITALTLAVISSACSFAQTAPAAKPDNATGICKDGTYSTDAAKSGACRGHHGVKEWYSAVAVPAPQSAPATQAAPAVPVPPPTASTPSPTTQVRTQNQAAAQSAGQSDTPPATQSIGPAPATTAPITSTKKGPKARLANIPEAPGGGPDLVWVNASSKVYHCPGTDFYGKTKKGSYMSEADAKSKGAHGVRGQSCSK